jgi:hypothetical protein
VRWVSSSSREIKEEEEEDEIDPLSGSSEKTLLSTKPSTTSSSSSQAPSAQPDCEYHFSYTEIPRVAPIAYREQPQFSPFGPGPPDNPWIEKPSRRSALPEFNSFAGGRSSSGGLKAGRKAVKTREEILGEPLTKRGVKDLVELCDKENRQINLGMYICTLFAPIYLPAPIADPQRKFILVTKARKSWMGTHGAATNPTD